MKRADRAKKYPSGRIKTCHMCGLSGLRVALKSIQFRSFIVFFIIFGLFRIAEVVICVMVHFVLLVTIKGALFIQVF